jgi:O-antigen/teichoic acid export membrane protein
VIERGPLLRRLQGQLFSSRVSINGVALLGGQIGSRLLNLWLIARLTRALGVTELGRYLLAMTAQAIALAAADLGLNTYTTRELAKDQVPGREVVWGTVLGLKVLSSLIGVLILNAIVAPLFLGERAALVSIVSFSLLPDGLNAIATALVKARQRMEFSSAINLGVRMLYVVVGLLLVRLGYGTRALLVAYSTVSVCGTVAFALLLHRWKVRATWRGPRRWWAVLRESTPFAVTSMATMLYARLDLLVLSYWHGDLAAGLYGAAYRLWEALGIIPSSYLDALFPELARSGAGPAGHQRLRALYGRGRRVLGYLIVLLVVPCLIAAPCILSLLYGRTPDTGVSTGLFRLFMVAFPFTFLYLLNGHALYAVGAQRRVTVVVVVVTVFNGALNLILVPPWRYWGAAGAALGSELLLFVLLQISVRRLILGRAAAEDR